MNRVKALWIVCVIALAVVFGCSDSGGGPVKSPEEEVKTSAGKTNDGHDVVVFDTGDLDEILFKIDTVYITDTSFLGRLFFRNLSASKTPEIGDIINSSRTKNARYGFLYRVIEVTREEGEVTIVSVSYASIAEAVEEADVEFTVPLVVYSEEGGQNGQILAKKCSGLLGCSWSFVKSTGETLYDAGKEVAGFVYDFGKTVVSVVKLIFTGDLDKTKEINATLEVHKGDGFGNEKNGGNVNLDGSSTLFLTVGLKINDYRPDYVKMSVGQKVDFKLEGNLHLEKKIDYYKILKEFDDVPDIWFVVPPIIIWVENTADIRVKVKAQAQADMNAVLRFYEESEYGFKYDGDFEPIKKFKHDFIHDYKYAAHGSISAGVAVGFKALLFGTAGLDLSAGPLLELKSPSLPLSANSKTELNAKLDFDANAEFEIFGFKKSTNLSSLSKDFFLSKILETKTLPSFNISLQDFDLKEIASGKLDFPFTIDKPKLGFSVEEAGICIEAEGGECLKGPGYGSGRFVAAAGGVKNSSSYRVYFRGLAPGTYNLIPYFKSKDNNLYYDTANAVYGYVIGNTTPSSSSLAISSSSSLTTPSSSSVTTADLIDSRDGQIYKTVKIDEQYWLDKNLNINVPGSKCYGEDGEVLTHINNRPILGTLSDAEVQANCAKYGRLYDWSTAMNLPASCNTSSCSSQIQNPHQGICPAGWHIPTLVEWNKLGHYVDDVKSTVPRTDDPLYYNSGTTGWYLKATSGWEPYIIDGEQEYRNNNGVNMFGFSALPGGFGYSTGKFRDIGISGQWCIADEKNYDYDYNGDSYIFQIIFAGEAYISDHSKSSLLSVRCVKD